MSALNLTNAEKSDRYRLLLLVENLRETEKWGEAEENNSAKVSCAWKDDPSDHSLPCASEFENLVLLSASFGVQHRGCLAEPKDLDAESNAYVRFAHLPIFRGQPLVYFRRGFLDSNGNH
jgi:hypothetical protein